MSLDPMPANGQIIPQGEERKLLVKFYNEAVKNNVQSATQGRPIYDEILFLEILVPGDRNTRVNRKATDDDKARFPAAWSRFERGQTVANHGTPIDQWPVLGVRDIAEMKAMNIFTVEQIGELPDAFVGKYVGLATYREQARAYIKAATDSALSQKQALELQERDARISDLEGQVKELAVRLEALMNGRAPAAKPGPKREATAA